MKHLLLYCRPGFEREVAAEIQDRAIGYDCFGFSRVQEHSGYVRFECYGEEDADKLARLGDELRFVLITSKASLVVADTQPADSLATELDGLWLQVVATGAAKCERCWHHVADVGTIAGHETICGRCVTNVDGEGEVREFA